MVFLLLFEHVKAEKPHNKRYQVGSFADDQVQHPGNNLAEYSQKVPVAYYYKGTKYDSSA